MDKNTTHQWEKMKVANVVSVTAIYGLIVIIILLFFLEIPERNENLLFFLLGTYSTTVIGGVIYFLFNYKNKEIKDADK